MIDHALFFSTAPDPLACVDRELHIVAANPAWVRSLGDPQGPAGGQRSLIDLVDPDDRARVSAALAAVSPASPTELGASLRARDGTHRPLTLRCIRSDDAAGTLYIHAREPAPEAALRAELARVNRRLAALFDTMHDMVYMTDENGIIDGANRVPPGLPMEHVIGAPMLAFAAPEELAAMAERYHKVRATGEAISYETIAVYPDGTRDIYSSRLGAIMAGDRSAGVVLVTRNITQERRIEDAKRHAEQQLREYMVQLERSNGELERFASIASHDLQEPLRKIQAFGDRLRERFASALTDTGRDYLERIGNAAKRMQDLINDLLMFSRLSAKEQTFSRVNLAKIASSVLSDLEVRIEETGGKVELAELPVIEADPVHMRQLLQNMIANALKFARPEVPPVVHITASVEDSPEGQALRMVIADNGIGIEPRHHDRIFGIFERLHSRGKYEGTGVGLAVCRKIVHQHHGNITVASVVDQGTAFTILLPVKQADRSQKR